MQPTLDHLQQDSLMQQEHEPNDRAEAHRDWANICSSSMLNSSACRQAQTKTTLLGTVGEVRLPWNSALAYLSCMAASRPSMGVTCMHAAHDYCKAQAIQNAALTGILSWQTMQMEWQLCASH